MVSLSSPVKCWLIPLFLLALVIGEKKSFLASGGLAPLARGVGRERAENTSRLTLFIFFSPLGSLLASIVSLPSHRSQKKGVFFFPFLGSVPPGTERKHRYQCGCAIWGMGMVGGRYVFSIKMLPVISDLRSGKPSFKSEGNWNSMDYGLKKRHF